MKKILIFYDYIKHMKTKIVNFFLYFIRFYHKQKKKYILKYRSDKNLKSIRKYSYSSFTPSKNKQKT